jgi:hypothetical protein
MKQHGIAFCVLLLVAQAGRAQQPWIYGHDQRFGRGRITTIEKLTPVNNPAAPKEGAAAEGQAGVTLRATDWTCCRCFTDERSRRWCLVQGCPVVEKPALLKGWIMQGDLGNLFFLHESGNLYRQCGDKAPANAPNQLLINPFLE